MAESSPEKQRLSQPSREELTQRERLLDIDEFVLEVGQFGLYQKLITFVYCLLILAPVYQTMVMAFVGFSPTWKCSKSGLSTGSCNMTEEITSDHVHFDKRCNLNRSHWKFTKDTKFSIVTEFDLVCSMTPVYLFSSAAVYLGWAIGAIILGWVSDRFGRKTVLFPSYAGILLIGFVSSFSPNIWFFMIMRLIIGFFLAGIVLNLFVLAAELVGPKYRAFAGTTIWFFFTASLALVGMQAYFIPDWRLLLKIMTAPYIILLVFWKFVPESLRWLRVNDKTDQAEQVLEKVSKYNKVPFPPGAKILPARKDMSESSMADLFTPRPMLISTLLQNFIWFINGMVYYGISLASDDLGGNMYRDFILTSLVEIPGNILLIWLCNRFGRKKSVTWSMFINAAALIGVAFIPSDKSNAVYQWSRVSLGMLGKLFITTAFNSLYVLSAELYPTVVRSQAMGLLSVTSRLGAVTSPWIAKGLRSIGGAAPFFTMSALSMAAALACLPLKETRGKPTAETFSQESIDRVDNVERNDKQGLVV